MSYCQAGDIARVTFPDGAKQDFASPIDIKCEDGLLEPDRLQVDITVYGRCKIFYNNGNSFYYYEGGGRTRDFAGYAAFLPVSGTRISSSGDNRTFEVLAYTTSTAINPTWLPYFTWNSSYQVLDTVSITSIKKRYPPGDAEDLKKKIVTVSKDGATLVQNQYDNCGFDVECIVPCPPNTLDCGGCCLDCAAIFNEISSIRRLISGIK
ncbi:hypothetical protein ACSQ6I_03780 [Anabaena sp. WFMT]|uniref:hypothetical protein n=1 Tax=Anabaena sp. WFMT TaxID=3449730 RepID=UPI003F252F8D